MIALPERTEELEVNVVTRAGEWMASLAQQTEIERNRDLVPPVLLLVDAQTVEQGISQQGSDEPVGLTGSQAGEISVETEVIVGNEYVASGEKIELARPRRQKILRLAHDHSGHVGVKKVKRLLNARFTWPGMGKDVCEFVQSCDQCARLNKSGNRTTRMCERPIVTEPFESVAVDIVGPLPKAKGGVQYILTFVCMATRWPEGVPMRTGSASEVAEGLVSIFSRTGFPLRMLSDRGSAFLGSHKETM